MLLEIDMDSRDGATKEPIPQVGEELCCADGCGVTTARRMWAARSTEINDARGTLKVDAVRVWVSNCCRAGLFFYRDSDASTRDCE
ncbi:hypothetical protein X879_1960 [Burkholderia pseudomallei MSHR3951]|uniref:hypothetical protein n=1 Tax=Burkholderia pseudomallei TaxID=28450 RepID=UPI0005373C96|nr:hypothetical protein [Burkholderia pseudomallei]KGV88268.1 hypothetical protein X879_1960 [Burkholderia pseudomallei MSHR3951]